MYDTVHHKCKIMHGLNNDKICKKQICEKDKDINWDPPVNSLRKHL